MNRAQTDEQMNMILDSTDFFGDTTQVFNNATQICVQVAAPVSVQHCHALFGAEDHMIMQA